MALTALQRQILALIASHRSPDSHIAGAAALNVARARISDDIDIFHSAAEQAERAAALDIALLRAKGYDITETERSRPERGFVEAVIRRERDSTLMQWTVDSEARDAIPGLPPEELGCLYLSGDGQVVDPLAAIGRRDLSRHRITIGGGWPVLA